MHFTNYQVEHFPISLMCGSERQREREMCVHMGVCVSACAKECVCDEGRTLREMMMMMMMRERERLT